MCLLGDGHLKFDEMAELRYHNARVSTKQNVNVNVSAVCLSHLGSRVFQLTFLYFLCAPSNDCSCKSVLVSTLGDLGTTRRPRCGLVE